MKPASFFGFAPHDVLRCLIWLSAAAAVKVFLLAGESSGDRLGAALMEGLKTLHPDVEFRGVAGPAMQLQGMDSIFPMDDLSVMGIAEVLPKYPELKRRLREAAAECLAWKPDVLVTIDSPDFSFRLARRVKAAADIPVVHYAAPQVWAWRPWRVKKLVGVVDHVLALLPFEPPHMEAAGIPCTFVGHPVVSRPLASAAEAQAFRARLEIGDAPLVLVLPGSRKGEISRLGDIFGDALKRVAAVRPGLRVILPSAPGVEALARQVVRHWKVDVEVIAPDDQPSRMAAFRAADVALAASGTVSLELAAANTPMVIAYDLAWLSRQIVAQLLTVESVCLVNLVSETHTVPEFIGKNCRADLIAPALVKELDNPGRQSETLALAMHRLGRDDEDPGFRAARAVLNVAGAD